MNLPPLASAADGAAETLDCLIVGAGPAGLTAALYLRRFHRHVLVVDAGHSRARYIERTRNFPGFPVGIPGIELLGLLRQQVEDVGGDFATLEVEAIARHPDAGFVASTSEQAIRARTVLIATGVVDKAPLLPGIEPIMRRGLLRQCPICDGHEHTGQRIAVLGEGPHAQREALFISHFSRPVSLVPMTPQARADYEEAGEPFAAAVDEDRVRPLTSPAAQARLQDDGTIELLLQDGTVHAFDVLYAALGCRPRAGLVLPLNVEQDEGGHLVVDSHCATGVSGIFAAGDVTNSLSQLTVAIGQGAIAATAIHRHCVQEDREVRRRVKPSGSYQASVESASTRWNGMTNPPSASSTAST